MIKSNQEAMPGFQTKHCLADWVARSRSMGYIQCMDYHGEYDDCDDGDDDDYDDEICFFGGVCVCDKKWNSAQSKAEVMQQ